MLKSSDTRFRLYDRHNGGVYRPEFRAQIIIGPSVNLGIYVCWNWTFIRVEPLLSALGPSITLVGWGIKIHVWDLSQSLIQALPGVDLNCSTQFVLPFSKWFHGYEPESRLNVNQTQWRACTLACI